MPVLTILSMVLPLITKLGGVLIERIFKSGYSTVAGTAVGGSVFAILSQYGCDLSQGDKILIALMAAMPGLISTDASKTTQTIPQATKEVIQQYSSDNM